MNQIHAIKITNHFERVISKILRKLSVSFQLCLTKQSYQKRPSSFNKSVCLTGEFVYDQIILVKCVKSHSADVL